MNHITSLPQDIIKCIAIQYTDIPVYVALFHTCKLIREVLIDIHAYAYKKWKWKFCELAAGKGYFGVLKWMHEYGYRMDNRTCKAAARNGHLEILQWCLSDTKYIDREHSYRESGQIVTERTCTVNIDTYRQAARGGHLHVIKWLNDESSRCSSPPLHSRSEETQLKDKKVYLDQHMINYAAKGGHIPIIEWLVSNNSEVLSYNNIVHWAAKGNQLETIRWLVDRGCNRNNACQGAARGGHLELLKVLRSEDYPWGDTCNQAVEGDNMKVLMWALEQGCPWIKLTYPSYELYHKYKPIFNSVRR